MIFEVELRIVKGKECRSVADADDAGVGEFLMQSFIQCAFARFVEGRGRLVEENPVGTDEQDTRKGKALLLAE